MKKILLFLLAVAYLLPAKSQDVYISTNSTVSFFSETPVENIDATSNQVVGALNVSTKTVFFKAKMTTFTFKKALMQEHFNENYVESEKYPNATFNGAVNENVDLRKEGTYAVTVTGKFNLHGIEKERTIPGTITVKGETIAVSCEFDVKLSDHEIKIPTVVVKNIAEVVKVKVQANMLPSKSEKK